MYRIGGRRGGKISPLLRDRYPKETLTEPLRSSVPFQYTNAFRSEKKRKKKYRPEIDKRITRLGNITVVSILFHFSSRYAITNIHVLLFLFFFFCSLYLPRTRVTWILHTWIGTVGENYSNLPAERRACRDFAIFFKVRPKRLILTWLCNRHAGIPITILQALRLQYNTIIIIIFFLFVITRRNYRPDNNLRRVDKV